MIAQRYAFSSKITPGIQPNLPTFKANDLEQRAGKLANRWLKTALVSLPESLHAYPGFFQFTGSVSDFPNGVAARFVIGSEDRQPAFRFQVDGRNATAAEVVEAAGSPEIASQWFASAANTTEYRAKSCYRSLLKAGRVDRMESAHSRPEPTTTDLASVGRNILSIAGMFGNELRSFFRRD